MKIYTKTGDKGTSGLYNGERRNKEDPIFEALGTTDELTSHLGLALVYLEEAGIETTSNQIEQIQRCLQDVGSNIATPREKSNQVRLARTAFDESHTKQLEDWIDEMDKTLPPLKAFILPSGGRASATLHVARTVCRRAERRVHPLAREHLCDESVAIYLNRLSDYLFTAARFAAHTQGCEEKIYKKF
ncbi:Adenosylcobalamin biosynthesis, ATP:cob(I)alamin adenosyltransferase-like protein [Dichotomocladium elegans]|nr:Adenosylcobalamin biosynthesis, ATP:cob(I)alamin adenosyltransferase-like protein [Dichotomocladium elegans]